MGQAQGVGQAWAISRRTSSTASADLAEVVEHPFLPAAQFAVLLPHAVVL
ncbi:hypothetical protein ABZZ74_48805 [Streptomyces sp. NPDC006476]